MQSKIIIQCPESHTDTYIEEFTPEEASKLGFPKRQLKLLGCNKCEDFFELETK